MKTLTAHEQPVSKIFSDDYVFHIPGYQRPYAWTTEESRELFEDLIGFMAAEDGPVEKMAPYFLGSVVLIKSEDSPHSDVVDGQQRLTTLTILLAAIRSCVNENQAADVTRFIYEKGSLILGTTDRFRLTLRERDREFFQNMVQREGGFPKLLDDGDPLLDSQRNIRSNAQFFYERLQQLPEEERLRLAQFIATRCFLVMVETLDRDSAYRVFSVLNSRGLDLSATDILKADIIGSIPETLRGAYTKKWEDAEEDLGREKFSELFSHIRMIYRKAKPKGTLIKEFKDHLAEVEEPTKLIDKVVLPMKRAYAELLDASYESAGDATSVNDHMRWLNRLAFTDWVPPALTFFVQFRQDQEAMKSFFEDLERLAYAMLVSKAGINERIDRFSKLTAAIEAGRDLSSGESPLHLSPSEQARVYTHLGGPFYESLAARARSAILLRLDAFLSDGSAEYEYQTVTVEHVLPQTPPAGSQWLDWFPEEDDRVSWVHRIGNLALLTRKKNSAASNYDFERKKKEYFFRKGISPFVITTQVLDKPEWTPDVVQQRQADLLGIFEKRWRLEGRIQAPKA